MFVVNLNAQTVLTLEETLQKAVANNQDIEIAKQQALLESQKVFKANVGLMPTVSAFASGEYSQNNAALELNTFSQSGGGTLEITEPLAGSMTHNAGVRIDYTLYDGGRGKKTLTQLQNVADLSALKQQFTTDNTLLRVSQLYLAIASLEKTQSLLAQNIELSKERLERAKVADKYAKGNSLSVLRAKTDLNSDSISLKNLQRDIENTKQDLLRMLNINDDFSFATNPLLNMKKLPDYASLKASALQKNPQILLANQGTVIEKQQLAIQKTADMPRVAVYGTAGYFRQDFEVSQIVYNQQIGMTAGFSVNYNLYDGNKRKREQSIQQMQIKISQREQELTVENVFLELEKSWNTYEKVQEQLIFEQKNLPFYEENLSRLQTSYKAGKVTDTDIRAAQLGLLSAQISIARKEIELQMEHFKLLKTAGLITEF